MSSENLFQRKESTRRIARCFIEADSNELHSLYAAVEDYVRARNVVGDESLSVMAAECGKIFGNIVRRATVNEACPIGYWHFW